MKMIVFASGFDVPGVGSALTKVFYEKDCSIDNFKMVTMDGFFSITVTVTCAEYQDISEAEGLLKDSLKGYDVNIKVLKAVLPANLLESQKQEWIPYKINMICGNQTEVLYSFMKEMAALKINVADVHCKKDGDAAEKNYRLKIKVQMPVKVPFDILKSVLDEIARGLNVLIDINPVASLEM